MRTLLAGRLSQVSQHWLLGFLLFLSIFDVVGTTACGWLATADREPPACVDPPLHLLPPEARTAAPRLFSCAGPNGPVRYERAVAWDRKDCDAFADIDLLLFTGAGDRHLLPYLFASIQAFVQCWVNIHVVAPAHEAAAVRPFLPDTADVHLHEFVVPQEVCEWSPEGRPWNIWKDIGQWVNLWADNFSKAEYIMQLDTDSVFNFPVTRETLFDSDGTPFLPFWQSIPAPWTELSAALFGHPEMQFMAYFPAVTTRAALQSIRSAVAEHFNLPFNRAMGQPKHFSQFDLIGHAMVKLGYQPRPCKPPQEMAPTDWCMQRPSPVAHVPYMDKCIIGQVPDCFIAQKQGLTFGIVSTDILLAGVCFLHAHMLESGVIPQYCRENGLGNDVHPRAYTYAPELADPQQRAYHFARNLRLDAAPTWVAPLSVVNRKLDLVLPWQMDVRWGMVNGKKRVMEVQTAFDHEVHPFTDGWSGAYYQRPQSGVCHVDFEFFRTGVDCGVMPDLQSMAPWFRANASSIDFVDWVGNNPVVFGHQTGNNWAARLSTWLRIVSAGDYRLRLSIGRADTARLLVDGETLLETGCAWDGEYADHIQLTAGWHQVKVLYADDGWSDKIVMEYSGPDTAGEMAVVPSRVLACTPPAARSSVSPSAPHSVSPAAQGPRLLPQASASPARTSPSVQPPSPSPSPQASASPLAPSPSPSPPSPLSPSPSRSVLEAYFELVSSLTSDQFDATDFAIRVTAILQGLGQPACDVISVQPGSLRIVFRVSSQSSGAPNDYLAELQAAQERGDLDAYQIVTPVTMISDPFASPSPSPTTDPSHLTLVLCVVLGAVLLSALTRAFAEWSARHRPRLYTPVASVLLGVCLTAGDALLYTTAALLALAVGETSAAAYGLLVAICVALATDLLSVCQTRPGRPGYAGRLWYLRGSHYPTTLYLARFHRILWTLCTHSILAIPQLCVAPLVLDDEPTLATLALAAASVVWLQSLVSALRLVVMARARRYCHVVLHDANPRWLHISALQEALGRALAQQGHRATARVEYVKAGRASDAPSLRACVRLPGPADPALQAALDNAAAALDPAGDFDATSGWGGFKGKSEPCVVDVPPAVYGVSLDLADWDDVDTKCLTGRPNGVKWYPTPLESFQPSPDPSRPPSQPLTPGACSTASSAPTSRPLSPTSARSAFSLGGSQPPTGRGPTSGRLDSDRLSSPGSVRTPPGLDPQNPLRPAGPVSSNVSPLQSPTFQEDVVAQEAPPLLDPLDEDRDAGSAPCSAASPSPRPLLAPSLAATAADTE
eukprot:CAMPEP_0174281234 /NCGR_PEP_ID=MMETSP0809-20121228/1586_1 /TAXON_ID=73025 ORGANISM="Eutreptiella gymnastica-like, Strain CCMP1594" /NCGR_SAMPLE_ID=MMETSP0809 /ASSEMBLY_ACC=CAM_ASM_000658 /LENGTH=1288 /DNA_ID=CAMNT_0015374639 /DNA_START=68 /DNA_END=3934 /DNA_ORIENTATION=-